MRKDVSGNLRHNERKQRMLTLLVKTRKYLPARTVASQAGITVNNASRQLTKLAGQGYLWRRKFNGEFRYRFLKRMGERVLKELWLRNRLRLSTGDRNISLNLKKPIPPEYVNQMRKMEQTFNAWRWSL